MAKKPSQATSQDVLFCCHAPDAQSAFLTGTFNGWSEDSTPMEKDSSGDWAVTLKLAPGQHEFKFVVDGEWCCDPCRSPSGDAVECVLNDFGTMNRVVHIS